VAEPARAPVDWIWFFFRFNGRVSRMAFFLGDLFVSTIVAIPLWRGMLASPESGLTATPDLGAQQFWSVVLTLLILPYIWTNLALGAKRLHDMGKPGVAAVALFVPFVNVIAFVVFCVIPGNPGPNSYGRQTNSPG